MSPSFHYKSKQTRVNFVHACDGRILSRRKLSENQTIHTCLLIAHNLKHCGANRQTLIKLLFIDWINNMYN